MLPNEYQHEAVKTCVTQTSCDTILMCALGLAGESGEVADIVKKAVFHKKVAVDSERVKDELGDILWYIAVLADELGLTLAEIMCHNVAKLRARHGSSGFNPEYVSDSTR